MTEAKCQSCGEPYTKRRVNHYYCSTRCRVRGNRAPAEAATVTESDLVDVVRRDLEAAGALDTPPGRQAMALAARMAHGSAKDTGSAFAAVSRELSRALEQAKATPGGQRVSILDELASRREKARGAA